MKTYIDIVTAYFKSQGIPFCREDQGKSVFVLLEQGDISIFYLFDFEDGLVTNWSILSWAVPERNKPQTMNYLNTINIGMDGGIFYVDEKTGCVAFYHRYMQNPKDDKPNRQSLENFCKEVLEVMPRYHKAIYEVAFKNDN